MFKTSRRTFLLGTAATVAVAACPSAPAFAQSNDVMRFITSDLTSLDPIVTTGTPIRNYGYMVFDTLYAMDEAFVVQPQMAEGHQVSEDGLTWTVTLRDGLMFHDDTPVTASDCVASIKRWGSKDSLGQSLMAVTEFLEAVDDKSFRFQLSEPFPLLIDALGKPSTPICFMMPERLAQNDASTAITEVVGSGPFRFVQDEWVTGSKSVYEKFEGYVPRDEPPSGLAGGKVVNVQRVEWLSIADYSTATAALQRDEADWYDKPDVNLISILEDDPNVVVGNYESGAANFIRFNHQQPPFNNLKVRQAVMAAVVQEEYLTAMVGPGNFEVCKSFFYCGTPMSTGAGNEAMKEDFDLAKRMLDESGYDGEKVAILGPTDIQWLNTLGLVTTDLLTRLGMDVELQPMDLGTFFSRRVFTGPVAEGGWSILHSAAGEVDFLSPANHLTLRGNGLDGWPGWFENADLEALRDRWMDSTDEGEQLEIAREIERLCFETVPYVPIGIRKSPTAYRNNVEGILKASAPLFWNVRKT